MPTLLATSTKFSKPPFMFRRRLYVKFFNLCNKETFNKIGMFY